MNQVLRHAVGSENELNAGNLNGAIARVGEMRLVVCSLQDGESCPKPGSSKWKERAKRIGRFEKLLRVALEPSENSFSVKRELPGCLMSKTLNEFLRKDLDLAKLRRKSER